MHFSAAGSWSGIIDENMKKLIILGILMVVLSAGCSGLFPQPTPEPIVVEPTQVLSPTPTIDWFPTTPTFTPTISPTIEPTPNQKPGIGDIYYEDDFSNRTRWFVAASPTGSIAYGVKELTIAITTAKTTLITQPKDVKVDNFYLEITANPSLCRENDVYGILFRVNSNFDFYRLLVSCGGKLRLERVRQGTTTILQDWVVSGEVPPGAPLIVRLGLWVVDGEIRVFANDMFQFGAKDTTFDSGAIGLFARSAGDNALTVSFRDLKISRVQYLPVTSATQIPVTATVSKSPTPHKPTIKVPTFTPTPTDEAG